MTEKLLYPERKRCRTCRSYMDFTVILRLFCSRECAGLPEQPVDILELPRKCRVRVDGTWRRKAVYFTPDEAETASIRQVTQNWYPCEPPDGCGMYHLGTNRSYSEPTSDDASRKEF